MIIKRATISNFRSLRALEFFPQRQNLLIGENNAGKSSVLEALNLCLGEGARFPPDLTSYDFFGAKLLEPDGTPRRIRIEVVLGDLAQESRTTFRDMLEMWDIEKQTVIETTESAGRLEDSGRNWCVRVCFEAHFDSETQEISTRRFYPKFGDDDGEMSYREVRSAERRAFGFFFVPCVRDSSQGFSLGRSGLLANLLRLNKVSLNSVVEGVRQTLRKSDGLQALRDDKKYQDAVAPFRQLLVTLMQGQTPSGLDFDLALTDVSGREFLNALQVQLRSAGLELPMVVQGHGTQQSGLLALYLAMGARRGLRILALEEPETGLHPGLARAVASQLLRVEAQIFATTHSPIVCQRFPPEAISLLSPATSSSPTHRFVPLLPPPPQGQVPRAENLSDIAAKMRLRQPLDFASLVFSQKVLIVEGETEQQWLHILIQQACDKLVGCKGLADADGLGFAVWSVGTHGETAKASRLCREHFGKRTIILLDGDVSPDERNAKVATCDLLISLPDKWAMERLFLSGLPPEQIQPFADYLGEPETGASGDWEKLAKPLKKSREYGALLAWQEYVPSRAVAHLVELLNAFSTGNLPPGLKQTRLETN